MLHIVLAAGKGLCILMEKPNASSKIDILMPKHLERCLRMRLTMDICLYMFLPLQPPGCYSPLPRIHPYNNEFCLQNPTDLDMLYRLKVEDERYALQDRLAAWACIRLDRLQRGYRFIRLLSATGTATDGMLLVKIEKTLR